MRLCRSAVLAMLPLAMAIPSFGQREEAQPQAGASESQMQAAAAIRRGEEFFRANQFVEALKEYQKALEVNRTSSLAHYRMAEVFLQQGNYQSAANEFRGALEGDLRPKWTEVWSHVNLGRFFDVTGQRDRAVNEYKQAERTKDNTRGALDEAAKYLKTPYERPKRVEAQ